MDVLSGIIASISIHEVPRRPDRPLPLRDLANAFVFSNLACETDIVPDRRSYRLVVDGLEAWIALAALAFVENRLSKRMRGA